MSRLAIGDAVAGRYQIREQLSDAPGYLSYRAFDTEVEVDVALWLLRPELFPDESRRNAFIGAAVDMRTVASPHLLKVFDAGRDGDRVYLTAQRGTADSLLPQPGRAALSETNLLHYAGSLATALDAAHNAGCIHGRLVPTDIVHVSGLIKVGAVGLWNDIDPRAGMSCWKKDERFLAPEVRRGGQTHASPASDVYSAARLWAELATGSSDAKIEKALAKRDRELANALEPGLSIAPERRPNSVGALLKRLQQALLDDQLPTVENPAGAEVRLPAGGFDSGTPIDSGGYSDEDDPTRHLMSIKNAPVPRTDDFPDSELAGPPAAGAPVAPLREARSRPNAGFDDELATIADGGMPMHQPPPPIVRTRKPRQTAQDGSGPGISLPGMSRTPKTPAFAPRAPAPPPRPQPSRPPQPAPAPPVPAPPPTPAVEPASQAETAIAPAPIAPRVPPPTPAAPLLRQPAPAGPPGGPPPGPLRDAVHAKAPGGAPPPMSMPAPAPPPPRELPLSAMPSQPGVRQTGPVQFVSMKPKTEPGARRTPQIAAIDRVAKPKIRPLASISTTGPQQSLGYYAPSRSAHAAKSEAGSDGRLWLYIAIGVLVVGGAVIAIILLSTGGSSGGGAKKKPATIATTDAGAPRAINQPAPEISGRLDGSVASPCPTGMVLVPGRRVCIDAYEAPGKARQPATGMSFSAAKQSCKARKARLCTGVEWEAACRGDNGASWPYGSSYRVDKCNAGRKASIALAGSYPECKSASGAFDMSGNVGEWIADGIVRGGSALNRSEGRCSTRKRMSTRERGFSDVGYRCCADPR